MQNRIDDNVTCYYCGNRLDTTKLGRLDMCPECGKYLHVCRMCANFDPAETSKQCAEDDAEKVQDKHAANFCDYFMLALNAFEGSAISADDDARRRLSALFGDSDAERSAPQPAATDELLKNAESLFRK